MTETLQTPVRELTTGSQFAGRYQVFEELDYILDRAKAVAEEHGIPIDAFPQMMRDVVFLLRRRAGKRRLLERREPGPFRQPQQRSADQQAQYHWFQGGFKRKIAPGKQIYGFAPPRGALPPVDGMNIDDRCRL